MILSPSIWGSLRDAADNNVWFLVGSGAPTSGTSGTGAGLAGPGSTYTDYASGYEYRNSNTLASPTWVLESAAGLTGDVTISASGVTAIGANKVTSAMMATNLIQRATGTIAATAITSTASGNLGHAQGVTLVAAASANFALQLIQAAVHYTFSVASYTAGGNVSINWGSSAGAALTGVVAATNGVGASTSKSLLFYPLAVSALPVVSAQSLNLVAATAFTANSGAAGTIAYDVLYRVINPGF
jgi:hypothetical protein